MEESIAGFAGTDRRGYGLEICGGTHNRTPDGEFIELKHGQEYVIKVVNDNNHRCQVELKIDGHNQGAWQLDQESQSYIERPATKTKRFTFYRVKYAPASSGIEKGKAENGLVSCTFTPGRSAPMIKFQVSRLGDTHPGIQFQMFEKETMSDLVMNLSNICKEHFGMKNLDGSLIVEWTRHNISSQSYIRRIIDKSDKNKRYLRDEHFSVYSTEYLSIVPDIRNVCLDFGNEYTDLNIDSCTSSDLISAAKEKLGLFEFYLLLNAGTTCIHSVWAKDVTPFHIYQLMTQDRVAEISHQGSLPMKVQLEFPKSAGFIQILIGMHGEEATPFIIKKETTVREIKLFFELKRGLQVCDQKMYLPDRTCLSCYGDVDEKPAGDFELAFWGCKIQVAIISRGGGPPISHGKLRVPKSRTCDAVDPNWRAGGTTLGRRSHQKFESVPPLDVDNSKAVTLTVRLVARDDEMSEANYKMFKHVECTPLVPPVPPQVPE